MSTSIPTTRAYYPHADPSSSKSSTSSSQTTPKPKKCHSWWFRSRALNVMRHTDSKAEIETEKNPHSRGPSRSSTSTSTSTSSTLPAPLDEATARHPRTIKSTSENIGTRCISNLSLTSTLSTETDYSTTSTECVRAPSACTPRAGTVRGVAGLNAKLGRKAISDEQAKLQRVREWQAWESMIFW